LPCAQNTLLARFTVRSSQSAWFDISIYSLCQFSASES
jgi:hypothetical protein